VEDLESYGPGTRLHQVLWVVIELDCLLVKRKHPEDGPLWVKEQVLVLLSHLQADHLQEGDILVSEHLELVLEFILVNEFEVLSWLVSLLEVLELVTPNSGYRPTFPTSCVMHLTETVGRLGSEAQIVNMIYCVRVRPPLLLELLLLLPGEQLFLLKFA